MSLMDMEYMRGYRAALRMAKEKARVVVPENAPDAPEIDWDEVDAEADRVAYQNSR